MNDCFLNAKKIHLFLQEANLDQLAQSELSDVRIRRGFIKPRGFTQAQYIRNKHESNQH